VTEQHQRVTPEDYARCHRAALIGYLIKTGVHLEDAQDAVNETLTRMCENWSTIDSPKAWARTTAYRIAVDAMRARRSEEDKNRRAGTQPGQVGPGSDDLWMLKEEQRSVIARIRTLPYRQRLVIALHLDGFTNTEIARSIGIDPQTVGSHLRHAKARLRADLEADGVYRPGNDLHGTDRGDRRD